MPREAASRSWSAPSRSRSPSALSQAARRRRGVTHNVLNAKNHEREAEIVAQAGRDKRGHDRHQHGRPRHRHPARRQPRVPRRRSFCEARARSRDGDRRRARQALGEARRSREPEHERGGRAAAACTSSAPSATSRAASTTSSAAARAARAIPAPRASTCRSRTTCCASSAPSASSASWSGWAWRRASRSSTAGHARDRERAEAGRGAQLRHPQAPARVRRRDEQAARDRLRHPPRRSSRARARTSGSSNGSGSSRRAWSSGSSPRDAHAEDWDLAGPRRSALPPVRPAPGRRTTKGAEVGSAEALDELVQEAVERAVPASAKRELGPELLHRARALDPAGTAWEDGEFRGIDQLWKDHLLTWIT